MEIKSIKIPIARKIALLIIISSLNGVLMGVFQLVRSVSRSYLMSANINYCTHWIGPFVEKLDRGCLPVSRRLLLPPPKSDVRLQAGFELVLVAVLMRRTDSVFSCGWYTRSAFPCSCTCSVDTIDIVVGSRSPLDTLASQFCSDISILKAFKDKLRSMTTFNDGTAEEVLTALAWEYIVVEPGRFRVANWATFGAEQLRRWAFSWSWICVSTPLAGTCCPVA